MFDLRFINVAADDTYCMAEAKVTRNLLAAECLLFDPWWTFLFAPLMSAFWKRSGHAPDVHS
jgi:hypothetical protein